MYKHLTYGLAALAIGCSSSSSSSPDAARAIDAASTTALVNGNLGGSAFGAADAIATTATASGADFTGPSTFVLITDYASACSLAQSNSGVPNQRVIALFLADTDAAGASTPVAAAGTYTVNPLGTVPPVSSHVVEVSFEAADATCTPIAKESGVAGTVTVITATPLKATFDLTFDNGDHVMGSYTAASCSGLDPNRTPAC